MLFLATEDILKVICVLLHAHTKMHVVKTTLDCDETRDETVLVWKLFNRGAVLLSSSYLAVTYC